VSKCGRNKVCLVYAALPKKEKEKKDEKQE
jgi:hypothetical protein